MQKIKRGLSLLLAAALVLSLCTIGAAAADRAGEYISVDTYEGWGLKVSLTVKVTNAAGEELETIGPFDAYRNGATMTISLAPSYYGVYELAGVSLEKGHISEWSGSFDDSYKTTFTWSSIGNRIDTMTVTLKEAEHTLLLKNGELDMGTIAYKKGLQRTNVNVFLNYEPFCSFKDVYIANSLNNFLLSLNSGYYYGVAENNLDYSSEIPGQVITFEKGGGGAYNKLTYGLLSTSLVNKDKLNTIYLYMFTYDDGVETDFTRAIDGNLAHSELPDACGKLNISFEYGGADYAFEYSKWDQLHKAFLPRNTLIYVEPVINSGYSFDCWKTSDALGDHANSLYTILDDGTLHEETGAASMEGVFAYSKTMAFKYGSGFRQAEIILRMAKGSEPRSITYYSNVPGSDESYSEEFYTGAYIDGNTFTYAGHSFESWNTLPNGSGTTYMPQQFYGEDGDLELYAQWTDDGPQLTGYSVRYYYDGVLDESKTESGEGEVGSLVSSVLDKPGEGYCLDRDDLPFTLTADESANVIGVYYATDANGDDIPDKYQVTVTYDVVNGSWAEGGSDRKQQTLTLMTAGAWDENGTAEAEFPGVAADAGYKAGAWEPADTTVTRESDHSFVYTFVKDESQTKPFSYEVRYVGDDGAELGSEQLRADIWVGDASYTVGSVEIKDFEGYEYERTEPALPAVLSEDTAGVITVYYKASTQPVEPEEAQPWIRVYMDEATAADFEALGGQQVRLYSEKYPGGYRACAPLSGYWWTENNFYKLIGSDIEKIVFAKDNLIGPSDKIEIPAEGNETYKVEFFIVDSGSEHYLKIYISKLPAAVYGVSYEFVSGTEGMSLPETGMPELPVDDAKYEVGAVVYNKGGDSYDDVVVAGGKWSFDDWDAQEKTMVEGGVSFTGTWVYVPDPETAPVYAVIYRNGNTETPFSTVKLGDAPLGSDYSLNGLDIYKLYSSAYGFVFEGWYNDGGWNQYKAGNPNNKLGDSITVNGWTNIRCMVTDYEKVVVKAVTDGDKDGAETVFDGKALHGLNTVQFLEDTFTPEERAGYELDKWYNWDWYGHKYTGTARINGWTNAYVTYTSIIPEKPGGDDVKALLGEAVIVDCVNAAAQHGSMKFGLIDGSFEVGPVEGSTLAGGITCSVSVSANAYVAAYNDSLPGTKHELVSPGTARVTLEWTGTEWKAADGSAPLTFQVRCELTPEPPAPGKPGFDDIKGLFEGKIYVDCVTNSRHDTLRFGLMQDHFRVTEPALAADGNYTCTVILFANAYQAEYNTRTGTKHYLAEYETNASVELKWNVQAGAWLVTGGELPVVFDVVCEPDLPPYIPPVAPSEPVYEPNWLNTTDHFGYIIGYEDGTIKPDASITRAEVATIFFRLLTDEARDKFWTETNSYSDVAPTAWYNNAVSTLSRMGILGGYEDGTFRPNASITRAEFAKIAVSFFEYEDISAENIFTDVAAGSWYENFVAVAAKLGLIEGYAGNVYRPNESITRAEACTIINRTLGRAPDADHLLPESEMNTWPDNRPGVWYYAQLQEATNSHEYKWSGDIEHWTAKLPERDWDALQR